MPRSHTGTQIKTVKKRKNTKVRMKMRGLKRFNRNFWCTVILAIQLLILIAIPIVIEFLDLPVIWYLLYALVAVIAFIFNIVVLIRIINSQLDPEFKIPWIVVLLLTPGLGAIFYIVFKQRSLKKNQQKAYDDIRKAYEPYFVNSGEKVDDNAYLPIDYLNNVSDFRAENDNKITYFKCGEEWFPDFIRKLKEAKEFIFMEFFIIHGGKEWGLIQDVLTQKASEGVEVRLLYDDFGCFSTLPPNFDKDLRAYNVKAYRFNKVNFILSGTYNNRSHRKIAIIDHKYAYTGGMNLGDEYANDIVRFGYWKDTMVRIEGSGINNLIALFLTNYDLNLRQVSDYKKYLDYNYEKFENGSTIFSFGTGPENVYKVRVGEQNYVNILDSAKEYCYISTPYLIPSLDLLHSLTRTARRGVDVRVIIPGIPDKKMVYVVAKYHIPLLQEAGVKVYFYKPGFNHMKSALADGKVAFVGTINMDYRSLVHHYECGADIYGGPVMKEIKQDFDTMIAQSELVPDGFKLSKGQKFLCGILRLFMPLL